MSKELIIASNSHETRVAVVEDDQVVEVYFQRENEYSLAGSIHKGRVTRVLPGMQSAFVNIGLERDAFLYVSDFFEDNEEYDKIVTSVEEKVLKLDKGGSLAAPPAVEALPAAIAEPVEVEAPPAEEPPAPPPLQTRAPERDARGADRDARDRRGRRSRRRRTGKGGRGGFPESKYYSPPAEPAEPREPAEPAAAAEPVGVPDDFFVLPGESLAKYHRPEDAEDGAGGANAVVEPEADEGAEELAAEVTGPEEASAEMPALEAAEPAAEPEASEPDVAEAGSAESVPAEEVVEAPDEDVPAVEDNAIAAPEGGDLPESGEEGPAAAGQQPASEEPEPARAITSLTATLREQGPRYLHRVSRRMRRKTRSGESPDVRPEQPRPPARSEAERTVARPEAARVERNDKPEVPSIADLLREGQEIIVQIAKEPLGQKGARITSHIALPGRFLVYMPTVDHIGVSRKISTDEERLRLKRILQQHRAGIPGGYIVRTAGEGHTEEELRADMMFLYNLWMDMRQKAEKRPAPALIHHDLDVVERILRDQLTSTFKSIWVDNEEVYENALRFVQRFQPTMVGRVKMYTRPTPIFDEFGITAELEKALRPKVWLKSGGYIVINQTEALVAIDVNTGKYVGKSNRLEDTIVKTNTDAIKEIVRQIRLRDLGGIIVVDFIDMDERKNRQKVMQVLEEAMRNDRAPSKILQFNDFGLVAITRKRVKQSLERTMCSPCPYCEGAGYVKSVQTVIGEILVEAQKIARAVEGADVMLRVNPEVGKVLKSASNNYLQEMEEILGRAVIVKSDPLLHQDKFDLA
jgi:ribonuclease G